MRSPSRRHLGTPAGALLTVALGLACDARKEWSGPVGESRRVTIEPFHADSTPRTAQGHAVAESLAIRLGAVQGLEAHLDPGGAWGKADFTVRGDVAARDGRLVVATRLLQAGRDEVLWTATFWRRDVIDSSLVADLTTGLAEAIYAQLAREAVSARRGKP